jgi:hypothetical protein
MGGFWRELSLDGEHASNLTLRQSVALILLGKRKDVANG